ncbi:MAG: class I SAM-dependent methyltransferase [Rhodobacter sp.]|nr:class I SAM-dependent methyltransferase [Rhodobacter sp.]
MTDRPTDAIGDVYAEAEQAGTEGIYRDWAAKYDADNAALGFRLPYIAAGYAARYLEKGTGPILDAGCGTGLVGAALQLLGYADICGLDLSTEMLEVAEATGAYRALHAARLGAPLPFADDSFRAVLCIGSFGPGHAPPDALTELVRVAAPGAPVIFNLVEKTWVSQGFPEVLDALTVDRRWTLAEDTGPWKPYAIGEQDLYCRLFVYIVT